MAGGIIIGFMLFNRISDFLIPILNEAFDVITKNTNDVMRNPLSFTVIIFLKNLIVAVICFLSAKLTKGIIPGLIIIFNGLVIGITAILVNQYGVSYGSFALQLLPHGIIELPALFLACAIGMHGVNKTSWNALRLPVGMLALAAVVESYVSPMVG